MTSSISSISLNQSGDIEGQMSISLSASSISAKVPSLPYSSFENDPDADVTFCSSDGALFHLQRKYLEANTGAFPGSEFDTHGEVTHLTESSTVLHLLFQFVYPRRGPSIDNITFETLYALAEASEKYEVFHAMTICRIHMKNYASKYPMKVLSHAARHDYPDLIQDAARHLLREPMADVIEELPQKFIAPWVRFRLSRESCFERCIKETLELRIASPNTVTRHAIYFSRSMTPEICAACMVTLLATIYQLKDIGTVEELKEALSKKHTRQSGCLSSACQYMNIAGTTCASLKAQLDELSSLSSLIPATISPTPVQS